MTETHAIGFQTESVEAISERLGHEVYGFAMLLTGTVPADREARHALQAQMMAAVEAALEPFVGKGLNVGSLMLRAEAADVYIEKGLPNARRE